jgi:hypothetical protein
MTSAARALEVPDLGAGGDTRTLTIKRILCASWRALGSPFKMLAVRSGSPSEARRSPQFACPDGYPRSCSLDACAASQHSQPLLVRKYAYASAAVQPAARDLSPARSRASPGAPAAITGQRLVSCGGQPDPDARRLHAGSGLPCVHTEDPGLAAGGGRVCVCPYPGLSACAASSVPATGLSLRSPQAGHRSFPAAGQPFLVPAAPALSCLFGPAGNILAGPGRPA